MINIGNKTVLDIGIGGKAVQKVEIGDKIAYEMPDYLCFTDVSGSANTLSLTKTNTSSTISPDLEYSLDKNNWNTWTETEYVRSVSIPANGRVWIRGNNANGFGSSFRFSSSENVNADGDLMTIINKNGTNTVPNQGLRQLFDSMQTLKKAPAINANTFSTGACLGLFQFCRNLTDVSNLKLINVTVSNSAFAEMFKVCSAITVAPEISINNFNNATYVLYGTFSNCTNLNDISNISVTATVAPNNTFYQTFKGCTSLETGLDISSVTTTGTTNVFYQMYDGCKSLTTVYAPTVTWDTAKSTDWLNNVATSGTLIADDSIASTIPTNSVDGCPSGWSVSESHTYLCFTDVSGSTNTLSLTKTGTPQSVSLEYSTDKNTWNTWTETEGVRSVTIPANGRVWLRGNNANGFATDNSNYFKFASTGDVNADGDLMRIINKNGSNTVPAYAFCNLFNAMNTLKKAPAVNATTYESYCFRTTFNGCRNLNDISNFKIINPSFPDNSSYQFYGTFLGCWGLTTVDVFNGSTVVCSAESTYNQMFAYCQAMITPPEFTISNTSQGAFIGMFQNCTSITDISNIHFSATSIEDGMFRNTFKGCTSLVSGLDIRSATILQNNGLAEMYNGCSSLTTAYAPTVTWDTAKSTNWLNNVASSGTLYADSSISSTIPIDSVDGCPSGWTVQNI